MTISRDMPALESAINEESWEYLYENFTRLALALRQEVRSGATPEEIRRWAAHKTGREALALRLEQAAAYLATVGV
jgi:hypothetical protein